MSISGDEDSMMSEPEEMSYGAHAYKPVPLKKAEFDCSHLSEGKHPHIIYPAKTEFPVETFRRLAQAAAGTKVSMSKGAVCLLHNEVENYIRYLVQDKILAMPLKKIRLQAAGVAKWAGKRKQPLLLDKKHNIAKTALRRLVMNVAGKNGHVETSRAFLQQLQLEVFSYTEKIMAAALDLIKVAKRKRIMDKTMESAIAMINHTLQSTKRVGIPASRAAKAASPAKSALKAEAAEVKKAVSQIEGAVDKILPKVPGAAEGLAAGVVSAVNDAKELAVAAQEAVKNPHISPAKASQIIQEAAGAAKDALAGAQQLQAVSVRKRLPIPEYGSAQVAYF